MATPVVPEHNVVLLPSKALDIVVVLAVRKEALEKSSALDQAEPNDMGSESSVHLQRSI